MAIPRRGFLGALALAPAALAGCASSAAAAAAPRGRVAATPAARGGPPGEGGPDVAAVRAFPLRPEAEPVLVFRAAAARPGEP
jgi:hypothetical protein